MDGMKKRKSRKGRQFPSSAVLGILCLVLAAGLVISLAALLKKQKQLDLLIHQNAVLMEDMETFKEEQEETSNIPEEASGQVKKSQESTPEKQTEETKEKEEAEKKAETVREKKTKGNGAASRGRAAQTKASAGKTKKAAGGKGRKKSK